MKRTSTKSVTESSNEDYSGEDRKSNRKGDKDNKENNY